MKTTRFALTAVLAVTALFAGGCSQSVSMPGGVEYARAFDEVLADRNPHAKLSSRASVHPLAQPVRGQKRLSP